MSAEEPLVSRDFDPVPGQWYEDLEREETFKVVAVDPDDAVVRLQWLNGEVEELDLDTWNELDLEQADPQMPPHNSREPSGSAAGVGASDRAVGARSRRRSRSTRAPRGTWNSRPRPTTCAARTAC